MEDKKNPDSACPPLVLQSINEIDIKPALIKEIQSDYRGCWANGTNFDHSKVEVNLIEGTWEIVTYNPSYVFEIFGGGEKDRTEQNQLDINMTVLLW